VADFYEKTFMAKRKGISALQTNKTINAAENKGPESTTSFFVVGIGASAGGLNAIQEIISQFPADLNAAVFIVLHVSKLGMPEFMIERMKKNTRLDCKIAKQDDKIVPGTIYFAAPDAHLLVKDDRIVLGYGPAENRFRPSIDVLFRSIAASHGGRGVGVVLTGFLNDGTVGSNAIKQSGGYTIVQDPNEAEYPDMPLSVLETMEVDHCVSLSKMGETIAHIVRKAEVTSTTPPRVVIMESRLSEKAATSIDEVSRLGEKSLFSCPDCGGPLWNIDKPVLHFRCHIGHSYSEKDLLYKQSESIEQTLWVSIRMMEERRILLLRNARTYNEKGLKKLSAQIADRAMQLGTHIEKLKDLLFAVNTD